MNGAARKSSASLTVTAEVPKAGANRMPEIIEGVAFKDGIKQLNQAA